MEAEERDVVVIGAGVAGLSAAARLAAAGVDVVVLEARDRVGGRLLTEDVGGLELELGGQWIAPYQDAVRAVIADLGLELFRRHRDGDDVEVGADKVATRARHDEHDPAHEAAIDALEAVTAELDPDAPWEHPRAHELDALPYATLAPRGDRRRGRARGPRLRRDRLHDQAVALVLAPAGGLAALQRRRGPQPARPRPRARRAGRRRCAADRARARRAARRPRAARRAGPRRRLDRRRRRRPRPRRRDLGAAADRRDPAEPAGHDPLRPAAPALAHAGRAGDLAGLADQGPGRLRRAVLAGGRAQRHRLRAGRAGLGDLRQLAARRRARRRRGLHRRGRGGGRDPAPRARAPPARARLARPLPGTARAPARYYSERDWNRDEWTRGAYSATFGVGGLSRFGADLRRPIGPIAFAGTDIAGVGTMHMDGAVRSGHAAADRVLAGG